MKGTMIICLLSSIGTLMVTTPCFAQTIEEAMTEATDIATKRIKRIELASFFSTKDNLDADTRKSLYSSFQRSYPECNSFILTFGDFQQICKRGVLFEKVKTLMIDSSMAEVKKRLMEEKFRELLNRVNEIDELTKK